VTGNYEKALESFDKAVALNRDDPSAYVNRAGVYLKLGNRELAVADLRKGCASGYKEACDTLDKVLKDKY
jgi:Flp pilus assembly protein TadD